MSRVAPVSRDQPPATPWRCRACAALLGLLRAGELHVQYKEVQYFIRGDCRHTCRRCGAVNLQSASPKTTVDARA